MVKKDARNLAIVKERTTFPWPTLEELGVRYGVTRERVRQILKVYGRSGLVKRTFKRERKERIERVCMGCGSFFRVLPQNRKRFCGKDCYISSLIRYPDLSSTRKSDYRKYMRERMKLYYRTPNGNKNIKRAVNKYGLRYPERRRAYSAVAIAKRKHGLRERGCQWLDCGSPKTHAHHPDYKKPLEVIWLCPLHHKAIHRIP